MRKLLPLAVLALMLAVLFGCEWNSSDDGESWDDTFSWVNFSGTYYGAGPGGLVVSDYTRSSAGGGGGGGSALFVVQEDPGNPASYPAFQAIIAGRFPTDKLPIVPGSITILMRGSNTAGSFTDDGAGALEGGFGLVGQAQTSEGHGTIGYNTGVWTLTLDAPGFIETVNCTYSWAYTVNTTNNTVVSGPKSGATAVDLYAFVIQQTGNQVKLIDSTGREYEGKLTLVGTTGGDGSGTTSGEVMAGFEAVGTSAAGFEVTLTGYLSGAYIAPDRANDERFGFLTSRAINGTWIERGGKVGDIRGAAVGVDFEFPTGTNETTRTR